MKKWIVILFLALLLSACGGKTVPQGVTCPITSLQNGDVVSINQALAGTVDGMQKGWSIFAYTRAKLPGQPYWRSALSAVVVDKTWTIDVVYGEANTPANTEFETVLIVTANQDPAKTIGQISDIKDNLPCAQISLHR